MKGSPVHKKKKFGQDLADVMSNDHIDLNEEDIVQYVHNKQTTNILKPQFKIKSEPSNGSPKVVDNKKLKRDMTLNQAQTIDFDS